MATPRSGSGDSPASASQAAAARILPRSSAGSGRGAGAGLQPVAVGDRLAVGEARCEASSARIVRARARAHLAHARHDPLRAARGRPLAARARRPALAGGGGAAPRADRPCRRPTRSQRGAAGGALAGDRRLSRPEVMELLEREGIATGGGHGYHILWRLAQDGLICIGPMQRASSRPFVLLDDWAPPAQARELSREQSLAELAGRFASAERRSPRTISRAGRASPSPRRDGARDGGWPGDDGLRPHRALGCCRRAAAAAGGAPARVPAGGLRRVHARLQGSRRHPRSPSTPTRSRPGANGIFRPMIVEGGRIVGTWSRTLRGRQLTITLPVLPGRRARGQGRAGGRIAIAHSSACPHPAGPSSLEAPAEA